MSGVWVPVLYALFVWWFSTGAILLLVGRSARTHPWTMAAATVALVAALVGLSASSGQATVLGAFCAFTCALVVWGWHETSFLLGYITGPRRGPCPPDLSGSRRFMVASQTVIHHEIAIALTLPVLVLITWGAENQVGVWTFLVLWLMRLSAKLNIFLGVNKVTEDFLPKHLAYLKSYFKKARFNWLLPATFVVSSVATWLFAQAALDPASSPFEVAAFALVGTLLALALLEHLFFVLPVPDTALWRWAYRPEEAAEIAARSATGPVAVRPAADTAADRCGSLHRTLALRAPLDPPSVLKTRSPASAGLK